MKIFKELGVSTQAQKPLFEGSKVLSIDPSTNSIAFAVLHGHDHHANLVAYGKIEFPKGSTTSSRAKIINASLPDLITKYNVDTVVIEETIYIQNPNTTRLLAYTVGSMWGKAIDMNCRVLDVGPLRWKAFIKYQNVRKTEIAEWAKEMGEKEAKKKAAFERKDRVRRIMFEKYPQIEMEDYDIWDAIAIGWWTLHNCYEENTDGG